jgi:hypothetical protein
MEIAKLKCDLESEGTEQTIELEFEGGISMSDLGFVNLGF